MSFTMQITLGTDLSTLVAPIDSGEFGLIKSKIYRQIRTPVLKTRFQRQQLGHGLFAANQARLSVFHQHFRDERASVVVG